MHNIDSWRNYMNILEIKNLNKSYDRFELKDVNLSIKEGYIMGFIGENGAGKTTVLKTMLNIVKRKSGTIKIFDKDIDDFEIDIKQDIAFMSGEAHFYPKKKISKVTETFKLFYKNWDDEVYQFYMNRFKIDENKKISELSQGMRMKYSIALALSHHAKLLILDEPTSGLDPVARDLLLDIFRDIIMDGQRTILFSTHITTDLEKCADYITFIREGKIIESAEKDVFLDTYKVISGSKSSLTSIESHLISYKLNSFGFTGLIKTTDLSKSDTHQIKNATLDDIMVYYSTYGGTTV